MKPITFLCAFLWSCATTGLYAQLPEPLKTSSHSFQLTRILMKDGTLKTGWFLGTSGDTLVARIGNKSERISRTDLLRVDIERQTGKSGATLAGVLAGVYAGNALALRAEGQPFLFMQSTEGLAVPLYSALFALVGGGVGYLVAAGRSRDITFDFSQTEEENASVWESLVESASETGRKSVVHFSVQGAWVKGPLPRPGSPYSSGYFYNGEAASSLNMVRKIQLTYSVTNFLDIGLASMWLGQPSISYYVHSPTYSSNRIVSLEGNGYYAIGVLQPFGFLSGRKVQWDVGVGIGTANVDFKTSAPPYYFVYDTVAAAMTVEKKRTGFSALAYTELKVYVADYLSLGVTADWVYVPDKVQDVPGVALESKDMGTRSVGFVLGFHF